MRCKCGSSKNVKRRFKDKEPICEECFSVMRRTIKEDKNLYYGKFNVDPEWDNEHQT